MTFDTGRVRLGGTHIFDSDGNAADGDIVVHGGEADGQPRIIVSVADAYPLALDDVQLCIPLDTAAEILTMAGYEIYPPEEGT